MIVGLFTHYSDIDLARQTNLIQGAECQKLECNLWPLKYGAGVPIINVNQTVAVNFNANTLISWRKKTGSVRNELRFCNYCAVEKR
jgi:hypothetical protein